jgi:tetratricopeptide (TPR) repeat protein
MAEDLVDNQVDFFISYDPQDLEWANWVTWQIEHQGFSVIAEAITVNTSMDYVNFVKDAQLRASHLIVLCSPFYLTPELSPEIWQTVFPDGKFGNSGIVVTIRVQDCDLTEFSPTYFDFVSLDETQCMTILTGILDAIRQGKVPLPSSSMSDDNPQVELVSPDGTIMQLTSTDDSEDMDDAHLEQAVSENDSPAIDNPDLKENIALLEEVLNEEVPSAVQEFQDEDPDEIISLENELHIEEGSLEEIGQPVDEVMSVDAEAFSDSEDDYDDNETQVADVVEYAPITEDLDQSDDWGVLSNDNESEFSSEDEAYSESVIDSDDVVTETPKVMEEDHELEERREEETLEVDTSVETALEQLNAFEEDDEDDLVFGLDDEVDFNQLLQPEETSELETENTQVDDDPQLYGNERNDLDTDEDSDEDQDQDQDSLNVGELASELDDEFVSFDDDDNDEFDETYATDEDYFSEEDQDDDDDSDERLNDDVVLEDNDNLVILDEEDIESEIERLDDVDSSLEEEPETNLDLKSATKYSECIWNIKMGRLSNFVGREEPLRDLHNYLFSDDISHTSMVAISGFPGVGKTQLVLEYSIQHENNYQLIWWVDGSSSRSINRAFFELLSVLDPDASPYDKAERIREKVFKHLSSKEHWLIVMDNVHDTEQCISLFPKLPSGHVIFTSLAHHWPETVLSITLDPFKNSAASEYLLRRTRFTDVDAAKRLINELGALPLALSQTTSYINRSQISISHYHQLLLHQRARLWERELPVENYGKTISERYLELIDDIKNDNQLLFVFLQYISVLQHSRIPLALFSTSAHLFPSELSEIFKDDIAFSDFLYPLLNRSLLVRDGDYISVAPLLRYVVLDHLDDSQTANLVLEIFSCLDETFVYDYFSMEKWALCVALDPHIQALIELAEQLSLHKAIMPQLANRLGRLRRDQGHYLASRVILDKAERLLKVQMSDDTALLVDIKNNLGLTNSYLQEFELAENQLKLALETLISNQGDENKEMAHLLHSFGVMYRLRRDNANAQSYLERSIEMKEKLIGPDSPTVASSLENLAVVLFDMGNMEAADSNFEFARKIYMKSLSPDHPDVAYCLSNIAVIHQIKGESQEAYDLFKRSVEIFDKSFNSGHPNAILARKNFSRFYESEGDYEMAESLYKHLQPIVEARYGKETYEVAKVLMDLARVNIELSNIENALLLLKSSEDIVIKEFGAEHVNNGYIYRISSDIKYINGDIDGSIRDLKRAISLFEKKAENNKRLLAEMYQDLGLLQEADNDFNSARFAFEQALTILDDIFPNSNPDKAYSQFFLARSLSDLRDYKEAVDQYQYCLSQFEELFGEDSLEVALVHNGLGVVQMRRGQYSEAITYFQKAGRVRLQKLGSDNVRTANSLNNIAMCKHFLGKTSEASNYFDRVLQVYQKHYGKHHHQLAACYNNLGLVLLDQEKYDEAQPYFEKAYQIFDDVFSGDDERTCIAGYNYARCLYESARYGDASEIVDSILGFFLVNNGQGSQYATQTQELQERIFNKLN